MVRITKIQAQAADGTKYTIVGSETQVDTIHMGGHSRESMSGLSSYRLSTGQRVQMIDDNTFKIQENDKILKRV